MRFYRLSSCTTVELWDGGELRRAPDHGKMTMVMTEQIAAGVFKAKCLRLLDEVRQTGKEIVVTKRGKPVARVVPVKDGLPEWFGGLEGTGVIRGDIISPIDEIWDAER